MWAIGCDPFYDGSSRSSARTLRGTTTLATKALQYVSGLLPRTDRLNRWRRRSLIVRTECRGARFGPTTPTQFRMSLATSANPTEAPWRELCE